MTEPIDPTLYDVNEQGISLHVTIRNVKLMYQKYYSIDSRPTTEKRKGGLVSV